jgi:hypothetical protein
MTAIGLKAFSYCICRNAKTAVRPLRRSKAAAWHETLCTNVFLKVSKRDSAAVARSPPEIFAGVHPVLSNVSFASRLKICYQSNAPVLTDYEKMVKSRDRAQALQNISEVRNG